MPMRLEDEGDQSSRRQSANAFLGSAMTGRVDVLVHRPVMQCA